MVWEARTAAVGLALALAHPAVAGPDGAPPGPPGVPVLTVGIAPDPAPATGFSRDVFTEVGRDLGRLVAWVEVSRPAALQGLAVGRFAVAAGPFPASDVAGFRALPPVASAGDVFLKRAGDGALREPADVAGKTVGILGAPADVPRLRAAVAALRGRATSRPSLDGAAAAVVTGRLAAAVGPIDTVATALRDRGALLEALGPPVGPQTRLVPAMRAGPEAEAVAGVLARMRGDGRLAGLQRRWFGLVFDPPDAAPTPGPAHP